MTIIPDCLSFSTYPYISARVLTGNRWSTEISVIQAGFIYSGTTYRGVGWREGKYSDQGPVTVGFLSPPPEGQSSYLSRSRKSCWEGYLGRTCVPHGRMQPAQRDLATSPCSPFDLLLVIPMAKPTENLDTGHTSQFPEQTATWRRVESGSGGSTPSPENY